MSPVRPNRGFIATLMVAGNDCYAGSDLHLRGHVTAGQLVYLSGGKAYAAFTVLDTTHTYTPFLYFVLYIVVAFLCFVFVLGHTNVESELGDKDCQI